ncbi:hypothetical protein GCM10022225_41580 [Plantactinospora mayteni]|uniref:Uncharacterized protein n=1 Tax=Plantactinospora mayteni TaxID=566021 RepID=A0ABQ4EU42_9ACTN|nr:hypothetical protein Pma05_47550 [Plantactinospora mayteni]
MTLAAMSRPVSSEAVTAIQPPRANKEIPAHAQSRRVYGCPVVVGLPEGEYRTAAERAVRRVLVPPMR